MYCAALEVQNGNSEIVLGLHATQFTETFPGRGFSADRCGEDLESGGTVDLALVTIFPSSFLWLCSMALFPVNLHAQIASAGTVAGTVTDNSGAAVPSATISLINTATGSIRTTTSSASGQYVFAYVNAGTPLFSLPIRLRICTPILWRGG